MSEQARSKFWRWASTAVLFAMSASLLVWFPPDPILLMWNIAFGVVSMAGVAWIAFTNVREQRNRRRRPRPQETRYGVLGDRGGGRGPARKSTERFTRHDCSYQPI